MKKPITILILSILCLACNNEPLDDNFQETSTTPNEENEPQENILILKKIEDGDISSFFNTTGKIESIANPNAFTSNGLVYDFTYSDNDLTNQSYYFASELIYTTLTYTGSNISNYNSVTLGPSISYEVTTEGNEVMLFSNNRIVEYTFVTNNLEKLINYKDIRNGNLTYNVDFEYSSDGNIISMEETINNGDIVNNSYTFSYDDKKNPIAESMSTNRLAYIIVTGGYTLDRLIQLSPNNIISNSKTQQIFTYEYNTDNYPISGTKNNMGNNSLINSLTFEYY